MDYLIIINSTFEIFFYYSDFAINKMRFRNNFYIFQACSMTEPKIEH